MAVQDRGFLVKLQKQKEEEETFIENSIGMKFALITAGEFMMGSDEWTIVLKPKKFSLTQKQILGSINV
ncbi:MAG TPA: hypothetical protein EYP22_00110 [Methanosarcinales archaeon]|nr:hypothetical protein [Methanosarcinales archaeon]